MMRALLFLLLASIATPALAQPRITEPQVRAFVARQEQLWNAGDLARYFAGYTADARFTDQAYAGDKPPVRYGTSTLAQALSLSRKAAKVLPRETGRIVQIAVAADGRSARVESNLVSTVGAHQTCAARVQTLVLSKGQLRSTGQTDTYIRCRGKRPLPG